MRKTDMPLRERAAEELFKLGKRYCDIARKLGCDTSNVAVWCRCEATPTPTSLAKFHAAGLDIFYIITGRRVGDILTRECRNCLHFNDCDNITCDLNCTACNYNVCGDCHDSSKWIWEGYANQH